MVLAFLALLLDFDMAYIFAGSDFEPQLSGILALVHIVTICGAIEMLRLRSLEVARTAMALACIPCLSPLALIGIPFGIWGTIVLRRPHIATEFLS